MNLIFSAIKVLSESNDGSGVDANKPPNDSPPEASASTATTTTSSSSKTKIFLRVRPTENECQDDSIYRVEDSTTLLVKSSSNNPSDSTSRHSTKPNPSGNFAKKRFVFSRIFNSEVDQSQFFEKSIKPCVLDFLTNGQCSTIVSYGTADSGKTYTTFGTPSEPGLVPRSIAFVYASLECASIPLYKPKSFGSVSSLDEADWSREIEAKEKLLSCKPTSGETYARELPLLRTSESRDEADDSTLLRSVWISFVEIYNDAIYDLLDVDEAGKKAQLKLAADKNGSTYVQGMRSVCANTGLEACEILRIGQTRLSTVSVATTTTASSYRSSRSHSIFIVKLLEYAKDAAPSDVKMTSLSFCDLAGPGRIQKSFEDEKQFRESRSINASLLALGRCFKLISEDQSRQSIGSFRESKLTRILQHSLRNKESLFLLINLNPAPELLAETQSILNLASTAIKLTPEFAREDRRQTSSVKLQEPDVSANAKVAQEREINDIVARNRQLMAEIVELKAGALKAEFRIRQELTDFFTRKIDEIEESWRSKMSALEERKDALLKIHIGQVEKYCRDKLEDTVDHEEYLDSLDFSKGSSSEDKSFESVKDESKYPDVNEAASLKRCLEKLNELVDERDKVENFDVDVDDDEVSAYVFNIRKFIADSLELRRKRFEVARQTRSIQCSLDHRVLNDFLTEIEESLEHGVVELPSLDDSSIVEDNDARYDLIDCLNRAKDIIFDNNSRMMELESQNAKMSKEMERLNDKIGHRERELLQEKLRYQESESARVALLEKLEENAVQVNSEKLLKTLDLSAITSDNLLICESDRIRSFVESSNDDVISMHLDSSTDKVDRSSSNNSKNDSGLASSLGSACKLTEDKSCQTIDADEEPNQDHSFQERLVQLKLDYKQMKAQHVQESLKVRELSRELDRIGKAMAGLKENESVKDQVIRDYQGELSVVKSEIQRLNDEKRRLERKCEEMTKNLSDVVREYEGKLIESQTKLKIHEKSENASARRLESYWEKSVNLGSELSIAYSELEKSSIRCYREHVLKIGELETEIRDRRSNESRLELKLAERERDLTGLNELSKRANQLEDVFERTRRERAELRELLDERSKAQSEVEERLRRLAEREARREGEIALLKSDFDVIIGTNLANSKRSKEVGAEVARLMEKMCLMRREMNEAEEARRELEGNANREINALRARLHVFKENAELLNMISDGTESRQDEVNSLKMKLLEKQRELDFFKKNRNATIQRYENLVRQLQDALKMNTPRKVKKKSTTPKQKYFVDEARRSSSCDAYENRKLRKFFDDASVCPLLYSKAQLAYFSSDAVETIKEAEPTRLATSFVEKY